MDTLQVIELAGFLAMACITVISLAWVFYLDGKIRNRPSPQHYDVHVEGAKVLSKEAMELVEQEAMVALRSVVAKSSEQLQASLTATMSSLSVKTEELATMTLNQEFEKYQASFAALREEMIREFNQLEKQLDSRRDELSAELESAVAKDREERMDAFNARLNDVVSGYIVETLDKGIDLGTQAAYIVQTLETHKDDIKRDVLS